MHDYFSAISNLSQEDLKTLLHIFLLTIDIQARRIDLSITRGTRQSLEILRLFEDNGITITDFQLRRPTLDDVFLTLTGAPATERAGVDQ